VEKLCNLLVDKKDELRDIASIGLKTVIIEIPSSSPVAANIVKRLLPKLLQQLNTVNTFFFLYRFFLSLLFTL